MATYSIDDMYDDCQTQAAAVIDQFRVFDKTLFERNADALVQAPERRPCCCDLAVHPKTIST